MKTIARSVIGMTVISRIILISSVMPDAIHSKPTLGIASTNHKKKSLIITFRYRFAGNTPRLTFMYYRQQE
ncbi:hypothetical protein [Pectobacterium polaris]|uniref:Secreted protein n=1 Tax=Pectobacterium polaris TaxID=2042057 RepID=A0AAW5GF10_9GAMM|nr:hypothetical protein [Pectobacterium polaris]MCL6352513.1 hypothetical protein [Pectobacterium polaris]MCL6370004.1 hypothetical protein [Pectobacterium polaris]